MESYTPPAMKPVPITTISDDFRSIRGTNVERQRTLLSAHALHDSLASEIINLTTPTAYDAKYIRNDVIVEGETVSRIDMDLIVDSGCRYICENTLTNGPEYAYYLNEYSVKIYLGGILHTFAQLPDGKLTWANYNTTKGYAISAANKDSTRRCPEDGAVIRQIYYPKNVSIQDTSVYTRIGKYDAANDKYIWGKWALLNGEKLYIIVTVDTQPEVISPIINAIYSIHCSIANFILPDAAEFSEGQSITIIQYPDTASEDKSMWSTLVTYTPTGSTDVQRQLCTPSPIRNTARRGDGYIEGLAPAEYTFVVSPVIDPETKNQTGKTWELQVDAEASDFTAGLTELQASHTDPGVNDIVDYASRRYIGESEGASTRPNETLAITRAMPTKGYVFGHVTKKSATLKSSWRVVVSKITVDGSENPHFTVTSDASPVASKLYFVKHRDAAGDDIFMFATDSRYPDLEPGHLNPTAGFPAGSTFYELNVAVAETKLLEIAAGNMQVNGTIEFHEYFNRHDLIVARVTPDAGQTHIDVRDGNLVDLVVGVVADPHPDAYISQAMMNPSAYSALQLSRLQAKGKAFTRSDVTMSQIPASTAALINAYEDIASRMQEKGLLTGIVDSGTVKDTELATFKSTGLFWMTPDINIRGTNGFPTDITAAIGCQLIVTGGTTAGQTIMNTDDQYVETMDISPDSSKIYYYFNETDSRYYLAGKSHDGHPSDFEEQYKPYYTRKPIPITENKAGVTQILIQYGDRPGAWLRFYSQTTGTWSQWAKFINPKRLCTWAVSPQSTISAAVIREWFKVGDPVMYFYNMTLNQTVAVALPNPSEYTIGTTMVAYLTGDASSKVEFTYTDGRTSVSRLVTAKPSTNLNAVVKVTIETDGYNWLFDKAETLVSGTL